METWSIHGIPGVPAAGPLDLIFTTSKWDNVAQTGLIFIHIYTKGFLTLEICKRPPLVPDSSFRLGKIQKSKPKNHRTAGDVLITNAI